MVIKIGEKVPGGEEGKKVDISTKPEETSTPSSQPGMAMGIPISEDHRDKFGRMIGEYDFAKDGKLPVEVALAMVVDGGGHPQKVFDNIGKFDLQPGDADKIVDHYMKTGNAKLILEAMKNNKLPGVDRAKTIDQIAGTGKFGISELAPYALPGQKEELINHLVIEKKFSLGGITSAMEMLKSLADGGLEDKIAEKLLDSFVKANPGDHFDKARFLSVTEPVASRFKTAGILNTLAGKYP